MHLISNVTVAWKAAQIAPGMMIRHNSSRACKKTNTCNIGIARAKIAHYAIHERDCEGEHDRQVHPAHSCHLINVIIIMLEISVKKVQK